MSLDPSLRKCRFPLNQEAIDVFMYASSAGISPQMNDTPLGLIPVIFATTTGHLMHLFFCFLPCLGHSLDNCFWNRQTEARIDGLQDITRIYFYCTSDKYYFGSELERLLDLNDYSGLRRVESETERDWSKRLKIETVF